MKKVLIVDDDLNFLESLKDGLEMYHDPYKVITARSGKDALKILKNEKIDLLVTDIKMPDIDGITLITELLNSGRWVPTIVMSAYGTPEIWEKLKDIGISAFLDKPLDLKSLRQHILEVLKQLQKKDDISGMGLVSVLQLMELERKTGVIVINSEGRQGEIFVKDGECVDAVCGKLKGKEALICLLKLENPHISIQYVGHNRKRNIKESLAEILIEFAKIKDEEKNKKEDKIMANIEEQLQKLEEALFNESPGIKAVAVIATYDGMPLAGVAEGGEDLTVPAGYFSEAFAGIKRAYEASGWGNPNELLISGDRFNVILCGLKDGTYLQGIAFLSNTQLGLVRAIIKKYKEKIEALLP